MSSDLTCAPAHSQRYACMHDNYTDLKIKVKKYGRCYAKLDQTDVQGHYKIHT